MSSGLFDSFKSNLMNGVFNLSADVIKVALMDNSYPDIFDPVAQTKWSDIASHEISSLPPTVGYTTGGNTIACTVEGTSQFDTTGTDGNGNCIWANATITAYGAVIYDSAANAPLIAWIDFGGIQQTSSGSFMISWVAVRNIIVGLT